MGFDVRVTDLNQVTEVDKSVSAIMFQYPDTDGTIRDHQELVNKAHSAGVSYFFFKIYSLKQRNLNKLE